MLRQVCERYFNLRPLYIEPGVKTGMPVHYDNPAEVGADRIVNAVAAFEKYGGPCVIVDFGTATTFDCVSAKGEYLGGVICPGIGISADALFERTARLPRVEIRKPARVIGSNTVGSLQSGLYYGYLGLVDGILELLLAELGPETHVLATGGLGPMIGTGSKYIKNVEDLLTLEGLRIIWERNAPPRKESVVGEGRAQSNVQNRGQPKTQPKIKEWSPQRLPPLRVPSADPPWKITSTISPKLKSTFQRRWGGILRLSPLDWVLMETWRDAGIPLEAVLRGIDATFEHYEKRPSKTRKMNGLGFCSQEVLAAAEDMKEAAVGAAVAEPVPAPKSRAGQGFEPEIIVPFLRRNADLLECREVAAGKRSLGGNRSQSMLQKPCVIWRTK